jgi:hypothetical protein
MVPTDGRESIKEIAPVVRVEAGCRLVEEKESRTNDHRGCERQALLLSVAEKMGRALRLRIESERSQ